MSLCVSVFLCAECDVLLNVAASTSDVFNNKKSKHMTLLEARCALDNSPEENVSKRCVMFTNWW